MEVYEQIYEYMIVQKQLLSISEFIKKYEKLLQSGVEAECTTCVCKCKHNFTKL